MQGYGLAEPLQARFHGLFGGGGKVDHARVIGGGGDREGKICCKDGMS